MALVLGIAVPTVLVFNNCSNKFESGFQDASSGLNYPNCPQAPAQFQDPSTIDQTMELINVLPKPLTLECFLQNLAKPMNVFALHSTFSAQSSVRPESPRIFILKPTFILSVVPEGSARHTLEMGEYISANESVKGEVVFPVMANLPADEPYSHILAQGGGATSCRQCHIFEARAAGGFSGEAYFSNVLRPLATARVPSSALRQAATSCSGDAYRCGILRSIFVLGQARDANFP